jgi:hypothetical protein
MANNIIQIYSIYNHVSLINMCLNYNSLEWIQFQGSKRGLRENPMLVQVKKALQINKTQKSNGP